MPKLLILINLLNYSIKEAILKKLSFSFRLYCTFNMETALIGIQIHSVYGNPARSLEHTLCFHRSKKSHLRFSGG